MIITECDILPVFKLSCLTESTKLISLDSLLQENSTTMSDEYAFASKSTLKLKGVDNPIKKKKKDKNREEKAKKAIEEVSEAGGSSSGSGSGAGAGDDEDPIFKGKTPSEIAYLKKKRDVELNRIKKRANLNHKEKVEKFNSYLNNLSEHYDIMKVSWTK